MAEMDGRVRLALAGGLIGGLLGIAMGIILAQRAERTGATVRLTTGEGLRLGVLTLGLLREVASLPQPDER
jgi:uncharacterized membrane protein YadS